MDRYLSSFSQEEHHIFLKCGKTTLLSLTENWISEKHEGKLFNLLWNYIPWNHHGKSEFCLSDKGIILNLIGEKFQDNYFWGPYKNDHKYHNQILYQACIHLRKLRERILKETGIFTNMVILHKSYNGHDRKIKLGKHEFAWCKNKVNGTCVNLLLGEPRKINLELRKNKPEKIKDINRCLTICYSKDRDSQHEYFLSGEHDSISISFFNVDMIKNHEEFD